MSDYTPQAWRFAPDGFYADQYALSAARLGVGIDYQDDDYERLRAEFLTDLAAHDAEVRASVLAEQGEPEWEYGWRSFFDNGEEYEWLNRPSRAAAEEDIRIYQEDEDRNNPGDGHLTYSLWKRVASKPGPWLPVEENGS